MVIAQRVPIYNEKEKFCFFIPSFKLLVSVKLFGIFKLILIILLLLFYYFFFLKKKKKNSF